MKFPNEKEAISKLTEFILRAGASLFKASRYLYALSAQSFYTCDTKDFFKVVLNNIQNVDGLSAFHIPVNDSTCGILGSDDSMKLFKLIVFSFAVRLPALCNVRCNGEYMSEHQMRSVYSAIMGKGITNIDNAIPESFSGNMAAVRKKKAIPPYNSEWFKAYLFINYPELADINNRNLFFIGAVDMLFILFYLCLEKEIARLITSLCGSQNDTKSLG
ncbi:MAG: hypothetical protein GX254_09900 [Clostridiales bacterium]|jgi:hypothetical protein|nr:hypothetical protein [Clostridiales bacterium]